MAQLEAIIGLEVHAQMSTKTKMFCSCDNDAWEKGPNTTVCPVCMGHPGTLPVPNAEAVAKAIKASLAIGCEISPDCHFDRKHYFYPDLPSGFQISQYDFPLAKGGSVNYELVDNTGRALAQKTCRITRLHMENDAGKLTHRGNTTLVDYNRAGTPLMEIVTEPDIRNADEAVAFASELRRILIAVDASDADMFKGMMRFDASISLREVGTEKLNPRSEIKNLNSFKALEKALQYEEGRLRDLWEETGGPLKGNITVGWVDDEEKTRLLRDKEDAQDYRYFPEPDIPPLQFDAKEMAKIKAALPALPSELKKQYIALGTEESEARMLVDDPYYRSIFDAVHKKTDDVKRARSLILTQFAGYLKAENREFDRPEVQNITALILELIAESDAGTINKNQEKDILGKIVKTGKSAKEIITAEGIKSMDDGDLAAIVDRAIEANTNSIADYKAGKQAALGAIVGWVMKESKGQANPAKVTALLQEKLQ